MQFKPFYLLALIMIAILGLAACGKQQEQAQAPAPSVQSGKRPASLANFEGGASPSDAPLPPGHPPIDGSAGSMAPMAPMAGGAGGSELVWTEPSGWQAVQPSSSMRKAQFNIPGKDGAAELVVFYFGPGQGGDAQSNAERWAGMFSQSDGRSPVEAMQTREAMVNDMKVLFVEITGSYKNSMAPMAGGGKAKSDQMLLGAIVEGPDANWFFKLTGPIPTVEAERGSFGAFVDSLRPGTQS